MPSYDYLHNLILFPDRTFAFCKFHLLIELCDIFYTFNNYLLITIFTRIGSYHVNPSFLFIDFIKKSVVPYPVT
ncbi:MAG: hypothetical protein AABZ13_07905, partial [Planctomycetota bacterium]